MALDATKWRITTGKRIQYWGGDHGTATANYVTVLELHRWLQDLADEASVVDGTNDFMDITTANPSDKKFDTIITLVNGYELDETEGAGQFNAAEFIYGGSIIQGSGGTEVIYDGISVVANAGVTVNIIQNGAVLTPSNKFWNSVPDNRKTASGATASGVNGTGQKVLNVSNGTLFARGQYIIVGTAVSEVYLIDSISSNALTLTTNLLTATTGGETVYIATKGINPNATTGIAMQFMVKVKTGGNFIDNGALLFTTREWGKTYSEFRIPATGRGVNVVPLSYAEDLNNTTAMGDVATWTTIANLTAGFNTIDVNQDTTVEEYYSRWDRNTTVSYSINQFYERMKYITRNTETTELYGIDGEVFRGITHAIDIGTPTGGDGTFDEGSLTPLSWGSGATAGTAQILANDTTDHILYVQLLTGVVPGNGVTVTQGSVSATTAGSNAVSEKTISAPFCGQSTGSSLVGAYGFTLEYADLAVNDKIQALDGVTRQPPNNVTFTVAGIQNGWRILVGPEDGSGGLKYDQLSNTNLLNGASVTTVTVDEAIPANTPSSGFIRIQRADGRYTSHPYSARSGTGPSTFTITSHNFSTNNAAAGANIFIAYIDAASSGTSISFNTVQSVQQTLYIEARYGGTGPNYLDSIKPAKTTGTLSSAGGSATISAVSDA